MAWEVHLACFGGKRWPGKGIIEGGNKAFFTAIPSACSLVRNFWKGEKVLVNLLTKTKLISDEKPTVAVIVRKGGTYKTQQTE